MVKLHFCLFASLLPFAAFSVGQTVTLSLGSGSGVAGGTVALPLTLASSGGALPAALEFTFSYTSDITGVSVVVGSSDTSANKSISCSGSTCLVWGMDLTSIGGGSVAIATFQIAAVPSTTTIPIQITTVVVCDENGNSIPASGNTGTITIGSSAPAGPALSSLTCTPTAFYTPATSTCTVILTSNATSGGFSVPLASNNTNLTVPGSITVSSGQNTAQFTATAAQVSSSQTAVVTAGTGSTAQPFTLTLDPPVTMTSLACAPSSLGSNASSSCTVTLNEAALSSTAISLKSNNTALTVPSSVTVASGQTTATFSATTGTLTSSNTAAAVVTGTLGTQNQTANVTLQIPGVTTLTSVSCAPSSIGQNASTTCTVTMNQAVSSNTNITVQSNNSALSVPSSITVTSGQSSATFSATTGTLTNSNTPSAVVTATFGSQNLTAAVTLTIPGVLTLTSVSCLPSTLGSNSTSTCTVLLSENATAYTAVLLQSSNSALRVPSSVAVHSGQNSTTFSAVTGTLTSGNSPSATVSAVLGNQDPTTTVTLEVPGVATTLTSVSCSPSTIGSNASSTCTVSLNQSATANTTVAVSSNNGALSVASSVTVQTGQSSATFSATTGTLTSSNAASATVTASLGNQHVTGNVTLQIPAPSTTLTSVSCSPSTIGSSASSTCTVFLNQSATANTTVSLSSNNSALSVPSSVTVQSGQSSATFSATTGTLTSSNTATATVTATLGSQAPTATITLQVPSAGATLTSVSCSPSTIGPNASSTCMVSLNQSATANTSVSLSSNNAAVNVPSSVTVQSGQSSASFTATTGTLNSSSMAAAVITATLGSQNKTATIMLQIPGTAPLAISCSPNAIASNATTTCTVTLAQRANAYTAIVLQSNNTGLNVPASMAIHSGQSTGTFSATAAALTTLNTPIAVITGTLGNQSAITTVVLQIPVAGVQLNTLNCNPSTIGPHSSTTCTVTLNHSTLATTTVSLKSNNSAVTVASSVAVSAGQVNASFTVSSSSGFNSNAVITATLNAQALTTTLNAQNQSPSGLANVTPSTLPLGVYKITVQGSGFTPDARVSLGGSPLATTFVSPTLLTASGYATESQSASLMVSDGVNTSASREIQTGVAQPRMSYAAAARFLQQASFGPQPESIMHLQQTGLQDWLNEQFAMTQVSNPDQPFVTNAVRNPDQLRQRVALALGQTAAAQVLSDAFGNYRQILGDTQSGEPGALDAVFNQPATGASVATQLIQGLVKANPSPAYVQRAAAAFNDNGLGVRGDMRSVVSAVLLDPEARAGDIPGNDASGGRLQADAEFVPGLIRALGASDLAITTVGSERTQWVASVIASADLTALADLAGTAESLADALDVTLMGAQMPSQMKQTLTAALAAETGGNLSRAQLGVFLVATSSEYNVRH